MLIQFGHSYFFWDEQKAIVSFFEASDRKHTVFRWTAVLLMIVLGAGVLVLNLDDLRACELSAREPILVEAEISVTDVGWWTESYKMCLSYTYDGVFYEGVPYLANQNPATPGRAGEKLTVALDPRDHGSLAMHILKSGWINAAIFMLSAGLGLMAYFLALRSEVFRRKREEKAAHHSWNNGRPDYILDSVKFTAPILVMFTLAIGAVFPAAYGGGQYITLGLLAIMGAAFYFSMKALQKKA